MGKIRIQTIGSFLDILGNILEPMGIEIESSITGCSPLAMAGERDERFLKYNDDPQLPMRTALNIRKNLGSMLSRDPDKFCQNYNMQPMGKNMRTKNTSEYIVFMNTSIATPIYERNGAVYSEEEGITSFIKDLRGDTRYVKRAFPFGGDFNWRFYYDKFIDAILNEYDHDHIILVRTNCAQWFMENKALGAFGERSSRFRALVSEMDDYFIEKTGCLTVMEHYCHIPPANHPQAWFPFVHMSKNTLRHIAKEICNVVRVNDRGAYVSAVKRGNDLSAWLRGRLSSETLRENRTEAERINADRMTLDEIKSLKDTNAFFGALARLEKFIANKGAYTLSDYALELLNDAAALDERLDLELVNLYLQYFRLDINDLLAVYKLYSRSDRKNDFRKIAVTILNNPDCAPVNSARKFKNDNIAFLEKYPYLQENLKGSSNDRLYIGLEDNMFLTLNANDSECFCLLDDKICNTVDYLKVIADGMMCPVECADALTYNCDYYIEKARAGAGDKPTYLTFESEREFVDSLNYIDYCGLLENERFVFVIGDKNIAEPQEYTPITNLTELMDPDLVTVRLHSGLGDQLCHYVMGQLVEDFGGRKVIYDDYCPLFNGCEIPKIAKRPITLLSTMLSQRLVETIGGQSFDKLYLKISESSVMASLSPYLNYDKYNTFYARRCFRDLITVKIPYMHIYGLLRPYNWRKFFDFSLRNYVEFPPLVRETHIELVKKMRSCDSVVIHIRRGDYLVAYQNNGHKPNYGFFVEAVRKLLTIPDYPNKKYFIFSDDLPWCKTHLNEIGLDLIGNSEIIYVDGNEADESFRDMQLMTYGKIMIGGNSGFFNIAAQYNENCEMFLGSDISLRRIKKNKYDVGEFTEKYIIDI